MAISKKTAPTPTSPQTPTEKTTQTPFSPPNEELIANSFMTSPYTVEYAQRVRELQRLEQTDIEAFEKAAKDAGVERGPNQSWDDLFVLIISAEFEKSGDSIYNEGRSPEDVAKRNAVSGLQMNPSTPVYQNWLGRAPIGKSGEKVRTNDLGQIIK